MQALLEQRPFLHVRFLEELLNPWMHGEVVYNLWLIGGTQEVGVEGESLGETLRY